MEAKLKENVGLYSIGAASAIIFLMGALANTFYAETGGYGIGFALAVIVFTIECFLFGFSCAIAQTRTKGALMLSILVLLFYAVIFIVGDIANVPAMSFVFDGSKYVRELLSLGVVAFVFELLSLTFLFFIAIRLVANLFGKEFAKYEQLLGTPITRRLEGVVAAEELPRKDTDKLFSQADRAYLKEKLVVTELKRDDSVTPSDTREWTPVNEKSEVSVVDSGYEQTEMDLALDMKEETEEEKKELETAEPIEIADKINEEHDRVIDNQEYNEILAMNYDEGYAADVRQDYIPNHTIQNAYDEDDDLYTDFSYGAKQDKNS